MDIDPKYYGEDFKRDIGMISLERDEGEFLILEEFYKTEKPILGICREHQLLNIFLGGSVFQDLKYAGKETLKHSQDFYPELAVHKVKITDKENILAKLSGEEVRTNSFHHQVINKLGKGLSVIAIFITVQNYTVSEAVSSAFGIKIIYVSTIYIVCNYILITGG